MFTGIVEEIGSVVAVKPGAASSVLTIAGSRIFEDMKVGDSIAVNGVCLTVSAFERNRFSADVMHETLERSTLGALRPGEKVNLERALAADGRFGGHIVSGHIDGRGTIQKIRRDDNAIVYTIAAAPELMRYIVQKGSIAVDGISLTVASLGDRDFSVSIIPHTAKGTILSQKEIGDVVNLENDVIGKYVERLLIFDGDAKAGASAQRSTISMDFLAQHGY